MSEIPPQDNPLLNTNDPQKNAGYLRPEPARPVASDPAPPFAPRAPSSTPAHSSTAQPRTAGALLAQKMRNSDTGIAGLIDTIEAVIIALILALTFRAFVVEAFVIPTGSMAPTLLGAHFNVICPKCGYEFKETADLNVQAMDNTVVFLSNRNERGELTNSRTIPAPDVRICPNCGYAIQAGDLPGNPERKTFEQDRQKIAVTFPWANNGDRILVLKYLYSLSEPHRWDVIVFKEPMKAQDNYIKRLVGLPGETLEIVAGDIFIRPGSNPGDPEQPMTIARKPLHVQNAVWQNVYDNDYYPTDEGAIRETGYPFSNPWRAQGDSAPSWHIRGPEITYQGPGPGKIAFEPRDFYLYNVRGYNNDLYSSEFPDHVRVPDVHLEATWAPAHEDGASLSMVAGSLDGNCFRATWSGGPAAEIKLEKWNNQTKAYDAVTGVSVSSGLPVPHANQWHQIAMNNVDRRVQFFIDGSLALQYDTPWTAAQAQKWTADQAALDPADQMPRIAIEVAGECKLGHLKLLRDVYYTEWMLNRRNPLHPENVTPMAVARAIPSNPVHLEADEFFAMGDNSTASYDSRAWPIIDPSLSDLPVGRDNHPGIVPRRFLLGKAFFVYWPAGFRPMNGAVGPPFSTLDIPLVPNVGEMRFIR